MSDLTSALEVVLQEGEYRTSLVSVEGILAVLFEDDALLGFVTVFEDVQTLLGRWQALEMALLTRYAPRLQAAGDKAWNVYCAFLTAAEANVVEQRELDWIEENQERTRKIAAAGILGKEEICGALLPVLPLQYRAAVASEDLTARLQKRIATIAPNAAESALDERVAAAEVARILGAPG
jgi:hypothetical protein